mmetsp:Transcript_34962/g.56597  ORF Transcript_34962/g.56597 Transcript_34962/m.56597 type:complete len:134 (-) Transcript_34962:392-793(-)|eukprot:CAMPEP_0184341756 /NCGR_PEP_ID=MMETSP1089-20130417/10367_1 /TAXON_ID=38269 ORGANISM="Gloeochaete wittrockiana, Strain SAG46.84" /NCGR_SAMPLE_ID=MMETSP1089 /ASSEMBLY_ACC=CAM_ASM_000445 /LENGTH=133 /DNA_ID=CAMNT_0026670235 /DNA_START=162 /DNA_END=563 /DNA_ORIENTATION=-
MSQEFSYEEDYAALKSFGDPVTLEAYTAFKMNNLRLEQDDLTKAKLQDISEDFKSIDQDEDQAISLEEYEVNPLRVESAILQIAESLEEQSDLYSDEFEIDNEFNYDDETEPDVDVSALTFCSVVGQEEVALL